MVCPTLFVYIPLIISALIILPFNSAVSFCSSSTSFSFCYLMNIVNKRKSPLIKHLYDKVKTRSKQNKGGCRIQDYILKGRLLDLYTTGGSR
jgi:hypothetical protein